jgi:tetratricopeptide (TPR) repeat protein
LASFAWSRPRRCQCGQLWSERGPCRALAEDPTSPELLLRIDDISRRDGATPSERIARYRRAIERAPDEARYFELMHAVASIEARELGSPEAAAATLREILSRRPDDHRAHQALLYTYAALEDDAAFDTELARGLALFSGLERQLTLVRAIERHEARGEDARALELSRTLFDEPALGQPRSLTERMFEAAGEVENLRRVLERRVDEASEPSERAAALERLGDFFLEQLGDSALAAEAWRTGARLCHDLPDEIDRARGLYEHVLDAFPKDQEAAERLVELTRRRATGPRCRRSTPSVRGEGSDAKWDVLALAPRAASAGAGRVLA